jgi:hypothetical protein
MRRLLWEKNRRFMERCMEIHDGLVHVKGNPHTSEHRLFSYRCGYLEFNHLDSSYLDSRYGI